MTYNRGTWKRLWKLRCLNWASTNRWGDPKRVVVRCHVQIRVAGKPFFSVILGPTRCVICYTPLPALLWRWTNGRSERALPSGTALLTPCLWPSHTHTLLLSVLRLIISEMHFFTPYGKGVNYFLPLARKPSPCQLLIYFPASLRCGWPIANVSFKVRDMMIYYPCTFREDRSPR